MSQKKYKTKFPVSRIKKIMQSNEEVGKMTQNTPVLISAAVELFIKSIVSKACREAKDRKSARISLGHLKKCILSTEQFDFLKDQVADVPDPTEASGKNGEVTEPVKKSCPSPLLPPGASIGLTPIKVLPFRQKPSSSVMASAKFNNISHPRPVFTPPIAVPTNQGFTHSNMNHNFVHNSFSSGPQQPMPMGQQHPISMSQQHSMSVGQQQPMHMDQHQAMSGQQQSMHMDHQAMSMGPQQSMHMAQQPMNMRPPKPMDMGQQQPMPLAAQKQMSMDSQQPMNMSQQPLNMGPPQPINMGPQQSLHMNQQPINMCPPQPQYHFPHEFVNPQNYHQQNHPPPQQPFQQPWSYYPGSNNHHGP